MKDHIGTGEESRVANVSRESRKRPRRRGGRGEQKDEVVTEPG